MLKIRKSCFETNSSSMDRYDDYDSGPIISKVAQKIFIELKLDENIPESRIEQIGNHMWEGSFATEILEVFNSYYDNNENGELYEVDDNCNIILRYDCTAELGYTGDSPATRYEPAEYGEYYIKEKDGIPNKNEEYRSKEKDIKEIMKLFEEHGWIEIIKIENIYGEEINLDDFIDNIQI